MDTPINGIKSEECEILLQQELDNANNFSKSKTINDNNQCEKDSKLQEDLPRRVKLPIPSSASKSDDWCILDCIFGVPLFDGKLNSSICSAIVQDGLWLTERYVSLIQFTNRNTNKGATINSNSCVLVMYEFMNPE